MMRAQARASREARGNIANVYPLPDSGPRLAPDLEASSLQLEFYETQKKLKSTYYLSDIQTVIAFFLYLLKENGQQWK